MKPNLPTDETLSEGSDVMPPRGPMQEMGMPDMPAMDNAGEVCVPLKSLAQPDDEDQMQTPAVGDSGTMQVDYTVTRVEGENAYVKPSAVNGQPLETPKGPAPDEEAAEGEALRGMALNQ